MIVRASIVRRALTLAGLALTAVSMVQAAPIVGTLRIAGEAEVTLTTIDFSPFVQGPAVDGTGRVVVTSGVGMGLFSPLTFGDQGDIVDRDVNAGVVPAQPAGTPINVPNWLVFDNPAFRYALDLTFILPGNYSSAECFAPEATGQTCTPAAPPPLTSPYNLTNFIDTAAGLSSNATLSVQGVLRDLDTGALTPYVFNGILGAEFQGQSYQDVLATLFSNGGTGSVLASYSGTINVTLIPEPSTGMLAAMGAAGVLFARFFRRRR